MFNSRGIVQVGLLAAIALPMHAGFIVPQLSWGTGIGQVFANVNNFSGNEICNLNANQSTCSESVASNLPHNSFSGPDGAAHGTVTAYTDFHGAHLYAESGASGQGDTITTGTAYFGDTIYNPTNQAEQFQFTFHLDAVLYTLSSTVEYLNVDFAQGNLFQVQQGYGGEGTYTFIHQDFLTPLLTVNANSNRSWNVVLSTNVTSDSSANGTYLAGTPTGYVDAGNTLSFTGISVFDMQGNPLAASGLTSYAGFDYSTSSVSPAAATPEPGTMGLMIPGAGLSLSVAAKTRHRAHHARR